MTILLLNRGYKKEDYNKKTFSHQLKWNKNICIMTNTIIMILRAHLSTTKKLKETNI